MPNIGMRAGGGAIGKNDGSENRIDADENGMASFLLIHPPGPVSVGGPPAGDPPLEAPLYALDGFKNYVVVGAYHYDNLTYGPTGPVNAAHFVVNFVPEPSSIALAFFATIGFAVFRPRRRKSSLAEPTAQRNR